MESQTPKRGLTIQHPQTLPQNNIITTSLDSIETVSINRLLTSELLLSKEPLKLNGTKFLRFKPEYRLFKCGRRIRQLFLHLRSATSKVLYFPKLLFARNAKKSVIAGASRFRQYEFHNNGNLLRVFV